MYIEIVVTVIVAAIGWVAAHRFTSARDLKNARNTARIEILTGCYKALVRAGLDGVMLHRSEGETITNKATPIEDAIALIHLHGTQAQSELASRYSKDISTTGSGNQTKLVNSLREDIRQMLGESKLAGIPHFLRVTPNISSNRVAGGFYPPAPTPPRMRVRTERFPWIGKDAAFGAPPTLVTRRTAKTASPGRVRYGREARVARSLPRVRAFTMSRPLRRAFGYYAVG